MTPGWIDILIEQPTRGRRILARWRPGYVRICDYDTMDFRQWGITEWKPMPPQSPLLMERRLTFGRTREDMQ